MKTAKQHNDALTGHAEPAAKLKPPDILFSVVPARVTDLESDEELRRQLREVLQGALPLEMIEILGIDSTVDALLAWLRGKQ